jgi:hypothetical protein
MYVYQNGQLVEEYHQPLYTTLARGVGDNGAQTNRGTTALMTAIAVMGLTGLTLLLVTHKGRHEGIPGF